ncbi:MAG TPA: hypothetical protein VFJ90_09660 [Candidatus Didemnitutus sp.]|nr:hypothetical protein [Candidatus Didemnitutus sp.]
MAEARKDQLLPRPELIRRLVRSALAGAGLIVFSLTIGILGYHLIGHLSWIDSFLDAAMILSGMGPLSHLDGTAAKLFAGCYAIYCGIALLTTAGVILAPLVHRSLHKFHLEWDRDK